MKKKVLFLCSNMDIGGFQKSLINLLEYIDYDVYDIDLLLMNDRGIYTKFINKNVHILTFRRTEDYFFAYKKSIKLLFKNKHFILMIKRLINASISFFNRGYGALYMSKQIPKINKSYDICIDYCGQYLNYYMVDAVNAKIKISYFHNDYNKWNYYYNIDKKYYNFDDYIITVSKNCVKSLKQYFPEYEKKIKCIENIITMKTINLFNNDKVDNCLKNKIKLSQFVIVTVGRVCLDKGIDLAIKCAKKLKQNNYNFLWIWVGPGEINKYQKEINDCGLKQNFVFTNGQINPYKFMEYANIIVHPARFEGKAVAVEEALVMNIPIIITNYSSAKDQIIDNVTGYIVPFDSEKLYKKISLLVSSPENINKIKNNQNKLCHGNSAEINKLYNIINEGI